MNSLNWDKNNWGYVFSLLIVGMVFAAGSAQALTCVKPVKYIVVVKNGIVQKGFKIEYVYTGFACKSRPTVEETPGDLQSIFEIAKELGEKEAFNDGVYRVDFEIIQCSLSKERVISTPGSENNFDPGFKQGCQQNSSVHRISSSTSQKTFQVHLKKWKTKERIESLKNLGEKWGGTLLIVLLTIMAVGWPWFLFRWKDVKKKKLLHWLFLAMILQLPLVFIWGLLLISLPYTPWQLALSGCLPVLLIALVVEFHKWAKK